MKGVILLMLCAIAACAPPPQSKKIDVFNFEIVPAEVTGENRNILVDIFVRQLFNLLRGIIKNGLPSQGIPPLDPIDLEELRLLLPENVLLNLDLDLKDAHSSGIGSFVVHKSKLRIRELTFDLDISVPKLLIEADRYKLLGNLLKALPLYGDGTAEFVIEDFRIKTLIHLKQSDDGQSVLIDKLENTSFELPSFKVNLTGVIGGGNIDQIINAMIEDVIINYVNRFQGAISHLASQISMEVLNPVLDKLDTWKYISVFL